MMQTKLSTAHLDSRNDGTVLYCTVEPIHPIISYRITCGLASSSLAIRSVQCAVPVCQQSPSV